MATASEIFRWRVANIKRAVEEGLAFGGWAPAAENKVALPSLTTCGGVRGNEARIQIGRNTYNIKLRIPAARHREKCSR